MSTSDELSKALDLSLEERMKRGERIRVLQSENALLTARLVAATELLQEFADVFTNNPGGIWSPMVAPREHVFAFLSSENPEGALLEDLRAAYEFIAAINRGSFRGERTSNISLRLKRWLPEAAS